MAAAAAGSARATTSLRKPCATVLAVPVAPPETLAEFRKEADETVCLDTPDMLGAIGLYYRDFHQMSDAEVTDLLARAAQPTLEVLASTTVAEAL